MKNWQFWVLVVLILISDFVIYCGYDYLVSDIELMWQDIITIANDTYQIKDSIDSYGMDILREVRK